MAPDSVAPHLEAGQPWWNPDEDDVLVCRQVRVETHDVKSFIFSARTPRLFRFNPGQFLTLELEIDGQRINRCYTVSSAPTRPHLVSITVKRVPGGPVSFLEAAARTQRPRWADIRPTYQRQNFSTSSSV